MTTVKLINIMRQTVLFSLILFVICNAGIAGEKASKKECIEKCKIAAKLIQDIGIDKAFIKLMDIKGEFVWKDTYIFTIDFNGIMIAHPIKPKMNGRDISGLKDINGKMFIADLVDIAKNKGEGWVDYMWSKLNESTPSLKQTFVYRVNGTKIFVAAGIYPDENLNDSP